MKNTKNFSKEIISMFTNDIKIKEIGTKFGFHTDSIRKFLKRNGYETPNSTEANRKYPVNHNYFNKINTEEKAYILGFLYADGYINHKRNLIQLNLQEKDKAILIKINNLIQPQKPLTFIASNKYNKNKHINVQNGFRMEIASKEMTKDLLNLGCVPKKTYFLKFPKENMIPAYLFHHFIRGFFDGDGCICLFYVKNKPVSIVNFIGTKIFCQGLSNFLNKTINIKCKVNESPRYAKEIGGIMFGGTRQILKFFNLIYKNATIFLNRKKNKFEQFKIEIINYLKNNKSNNVYKNVKGSKNPWRVIKRFNDKTITVGTYSKYKQAVIFSKKWDKRNKQIPWFESISL